MTFDANFSLADRGASHEEHLRPSEEALRRASVVLRAVSLECVQALAGRFHFRQFKFGQELSEDGETFVLLESGTASRRSPSGEHLDSPRLRLGRGDCVGEVSLLGYGGACAASISPLVCLSPCTGWALARRDFGEVLGEFPRDAERMTRVMAQEGQIGSTTLSGALRASTLFADTGEAFRGLLGPHCTDVVLDAGAALPRFDGGDASPSRGEDGSTAALFVVVAGTLSVEGGGGEVLRVAQPGEVVGEAVALDLMECPFAGAFARAGPGGPCYCLRVPRAALQAAFHAHPEELMPIEDLVREAEAERVRAAAARIAWVAEVAAPALARTPLLAGCPDGFIGAVAGQATEATYAPGEEIVSAGDAAETMLVLLEGVAELLSRSGAPVGRLAAGGTLGEVEALGVFSVSMLTARAASPCRVLRVAREGLRQALAGDAGVPLREGFERLVESRRAQVESGMPLQGLKISGSAADVSLKTISLQAERVPLDAKEVWEPMSDQDPSGPRIGILVAGRAVLEHTESGREVMPIMAGTVLPEGLLFDFRARIRAVSSDCEAYRIRLHDLLAASKFDAREPDWFYQYRVCERESTQKLRARLVNAKGLANNKKAHPCDPCITDWKMRRQESVRRAKEMRADRAGTLLDGRGSLPQLPLLPPSNFGSTSYRSWEKVQAPAPIFPSSVFPRKSRSASIKTRGSQSSLRLPRISSDPQLRVKESRSSTPRALEA